MTDNTRTFIMEDEHHHESCCQSHTQSASSVYQTLDEMDFERGIWKAALDGDISHMKILLDRGVDVNQPDVYGYTAMHYAARNGETEAVKFLLKNKADPNHKTKSGEATPLHRAAYQGHQDIVSLLLQHGAIAHLKDADGKTALHKAAERDQTQICNILISKYPHLKLEMDNKGMKPHDLATDEPCRQLLQCFKSEEKEDL